MADLLTPGDLAYMRATQAEAFPDTAQHRAAGRTRTATGGYTTTLGAPVDVRVRIDTEPDTVPDALASRWEGGTLAKVTTRLGLDVRDGDTFTVTTTLEGVTTTSTYEVVTDGEQDTWATAQVVWTRRLDRPVRG